MDQLETTEKPKVESTEDTQSYIDQLMSQYSSPAKGLENAISQPAPTTQPVGATPTPASTSIPTLQLQPNSNAPYGYYKKGKNKGKPRPAPLGSPQPNVVQPTQLTQPAPAKISGMLIDGGLFLTLINIAVPLLICVVHNFIEKDKDKHINPEKLKLNNDQKKELDPVCDAVMKQIQLTGNPLVILLIGLMTAYGLNFMALKLEQK